MAEKEEKEEKDREEEEEVRYDHVTTFQIINNKWK